MSVYTKRGCLKIKIHYHFVMSNKMKNRIVTTAIFHFDRNDDLILTLDTPFL